MLKKVRINPAICRKAHVETIVMKLLFFCFVLYLGCEGLIFLLSGSSRVCLLIMLLSGRYRPRD